MMSQHNSNNPDYYPVIWGILHMLDQLLISLFLLLIFPFTFFQLLGPKFLLLNLLMPIAGVVPFYILIKLCYTWVKSDFSFQQLYHEELGDKNPDNKQKLLSLVASLILILSITLFSVFLVDAFW